MPQDPAKYLAAMAEKNAAKKAALTNNPVEIERRRKERLERGYTTDFVGTTVRGRASGATPPRPPARGASAAARQQPAEAAAAEGAGGASRARTAEPKGWALGTQHDPLLLPQVTTEAPAARPRSKHCRHRSHLLLQLLTLPLPPPPQSTREHLYAAEIDAEQSALEAELSAVESAQRTADANQRAWTVSCDCDSCRGF